MREIIPSLRRLAILGNVTGASVVAEITEAREAARTLGLEVVVSELHRADDINPAIKALKGHADALYVCGGYLTLQTRKQIVDLVAQQQLPAMYAFREFVEEGGLMSYAANLVDVYRRAATYVDKILRGATPAELPIEQARKVELVLNLKTAQAVGVTFPPTLLLLADEVIR